MDIGETKNRLTLVSIAGISKDRCRTGYFTCSCGKSDLLKTISEVNRGRIKSCGCLKGDRIRKAPGQSSSHNLYLSYKLAAHRRGYCFNLTEKQFLKLTKQECHYCGTPPMTIKKVKDYYGEYVYNGVDRKDNTQGYELSNCLTACGHCNLAKRQLTHTDFIMLCKRIAKRFECS